MRKWIVAFAALAVAAGFLLRETRASRSTPTSEADEQDTAEAEADETASAPSAEETPPTAPVAESKRATPDAPALPAVWNEEDEAEPPPAPPKKLDPTSQAYFVHLDEGLPRVMRRFAADRCWDPKRIDIEDQKLVLGLRQRFKDGEVIILDAWVIRTTMTDSNIQRCLIDAIRGARWRDPQLPDGEREDELMIRFGGLKKFASNGPDPELGEDPKAPRGIR